MADPAIFVRAFYLVASLSVLALQLIPALRRFLSYGSRAATVAKPAAPPSDLDRLLDAAAAIQVPHNWFTHFYILSVACSLFWAYVLPIWTASPQTQVVWGLMLLQGVRRMLESIAFTSSSKSSPMWVGHWALGLLYYLATSVAVWAEHQACELSSRHTTVLVPAILLAHGLQHSYHAYLYELRTENKGYQLPSHPFFPSLLCPHYTCEIAIYLLLSFLAAPEGRLVNWSLICATIFVATNLGVTAKGTKEWYIRKFGAAKVGSRTRMIPFVW